MNMEEIHTHTHTHTHSHSELQQILTCNVLAHTFLKRRGNGRFFLMSCPLTFQSGIFNPVQIKTLSCSDTRAPQYKAPNLWFPTAENPIKITFSLTRALLRNAKYAASPVHF